MIKVINNDRKCIEERTKRQALIAEQEEKIKDTIRRLLNLQKKTFFPIHYSYEVLPFDTKGNLKPFDTAVFSVKRHRCTGQRTHRSSRGCRL